MSTIPDEIVDKIEVRRDLYKEARRLSNLPEIKDFIATYCELFREPVEANADVIGKPKNRWTYRIKGRDQTRPTIFFKQIIRDNLSPSVTNGKTPMNWTDLETKIDMLVPLLLSVSVPENRRPRRPLAPIPQRGSQRHGNQGGGQGQGQGGPPSN